jgi:CcmD family protein
VRRSSIRILWLLFLVLSAIPPIRAQEPDSLGSAAVVENEAVFRVQFAQIPSAIGDPLPVRPVPPRTLQDYWHVFATFALAWILLFGYVLRIGRHFARVEREIAQTREKLRA